MKLQNQQGMALITSLIFLVILTLIAVTTAQTTILEEKMAANMRNANTAFQSAESAAREAERCIRQTTIESEIDSQCSNLWSLDGPDNDTSDGLPWWITRTDNWWQDSNNAQASSSDLAVVTSSPVYVIENQSFVKDSLNIDDTSGMDYYRITAKGYGMSDKSISVIQVTVSKRYQ